MPTIDPFAADAAVAAKLVVVLTKELAGLTGDVLNEKFAKVQSQALIANDLNQLSIMWRKKNMQLVVEKLEAMVRTEAVRQSDFFGRLKTKLGELTGTSGTAVAQESTETTEPTTGKTITVALPKINPDKRDTSLELLHPLMREKVMALMDDLQANSIPMKIFEAYRSPERQDHLYAIGRTREMHRGRVTFVKAWHSRHQYGLAVDMVIDHPDYSMWDTENDKPKAWWKRYHELAEIHDLEPVNFELVHIQLKGMVASKLLAGEQPSAGDDSWEQNFRNAVINWPGADKPRLRDEDKPGLASFALQTGKASAQVDWSAMPPLSDFAWTSRFGGQEWRADDNGIYLRGEPNSPLRTPGEPSTASSALNEFADNIAEASQKFSVPPELILMTIATETGFMKSEGFTGPRTFRWEKNVTLTTTGDVALDGKEKGDYSAGPMQVLSNTAREVNKKQDLGFDNGSDLKWFKNKPAKAPAKLGLYEGTTCVLIGTGYIAQQRSKTDLNPVLVSAAYNAGSLRASGTNIWKIFFHHDHVDRACNWFGDACAVMKLFGR